MISNNISIIPSFASHAQALIPIIHNYLSEDSHQKIAISKSFSSQKPFILPVQNADAECVTVEDFLLLLDSRMFAEFAYREEITQLKNNLCNHFNQLCENVSDEDFIKFVRNQRQRVIDCVIDETKIEEKMIAEKFFNDMISGFEEEALSMNKFIDIMDAVVWKPLLTPLPIESVDKLKKLLEKLEVEKSKSSIEGIADQLIKHIQFHMKIKKIKDSQLNLNKKLRTTLEEMVAARQICSIEITNLIESENVLMEFINKCISKVRLVISTKLFKEMELKINYDELQLEEAIEQNEVEIVFNKVHRRVKVLNIKFGKNLNWKTIKKCMVELKKLKKLTIDVHSRKIRVEDTKYMSTALKELSYISTLTLDLGKNNIGAEGATRVSDALKQMKLILILHLDLETNNIGDEGAIAVSDALIELNSLFFIKPRLRQQQYQ